MARASGPGRIWGNADHVTRTCGYDTILLSSVINWRSKTRAVATNDWPAGFATGSARALSIHRAIQFQPSVFYKLGYFPAGDDSNSEDPVKAMIEEFAVLKL